MLKISTKGDYGLLFLSGLAEKYTSPTRYISLKEIAEKKHMPVQYLAQIINTLKRAGIVVSKEGRDGGYRLAKKPEKISLLEVLEALEGKVAPVRCCKEDESKCACSSACGVKFLWKQATHQVEDYLKGKTLADTVTITAHGTGGAAETIR